MGKIVPDQRIVSDWRLLNLPLECFKIKSLTYRLASNIVLLGHVILQSDTVVVCVIAEEHYRSSSGTSSIRLVRIVNHAVLIPKHIFAAHVAAVLKLVALRLSLLVWFKHYVLGILPNPL